MFSEWTAIISLTSSNQPIFIMVKCGVLFEVRTELLNIIRRLSASKGPVDLFNGYRFCFLWRKDWVNNLIIRRASP
jgi:hypothetical protein